MRPIGLGAAPLLLAGCGRSQSALEPEGPAARSIATLWWVMLVGFGVVFGVVLVLLLAAVIRGRGRSEPVPGDPRFGRRLVLVGGAVVPFLVLIALFALILHTLPKTSQPTAHAATSLTIQVTGRQWFWDVRYPGAGVVTANELHVPVGRPVRVEVSTADVIHSFWVPALNRKIDMIPGKPNAIVLRADRAGVFRGQCAEFCGLQHAHMAFFVIAEPPARFQAWLQRERRPAQTSGPGWRVFDDVGCSGCHAINGKGGHVGPDLTHVASRRSLAAGTIPNGPGFLAGWILDPQHVKPGSKMPGLHLTGAQVQALLAYLQTLR